MKFAHCPYMDQLGRELIEAYRCNDEQVEQLAREDGLTPAEKVFAAHQAITQHRATCSICSEIDHNFANVLDRRTASP